MSTEKVSWQEAYLNRFYRGRPEWRDGSSEFHDLIGCYAATGRCLEIGSGPSNETSRYLSQHSAVLVGLDVDKTAPANDFLSSAVLYNGKNIPFRDHCFDGVICNYVLEHVWDPALLFREISRVVVPGGHFIFRTQNVFHYVGLVAALTPHSLHLYLANRLRNRMAEAGDPYPTAYRANSRRRIRELAKQANMKEVVCRMVEKEPSYCLFNKAAFRMGVIYERVVNKLTILAVIRSNIFGVFKAGG